MKISEQDVLIVVDVQNDFCSGGALAVPGGEKVVPAINRIAEKFSKCGGDAGLASRGPRVLRLQPSPQASL